MIVCNKDESAFNLNHCASELAPLRLGKNRSFTIDNVYKPSDGQAGIYSDLVAPLVEACFNGYNATVLAYGQTGQGGGAS